MNTALCFSGQVLRGLMFEEDKDHDGEHDCAEQDTGELRENTEDAQPSLELFVPLRPQAIELDGSLGGVRWFLACGVAYWANWVFQRGERCIVAWVDGMHGVASCLLLLMLGDMEGGLVVRGGSHAEERVLERRQI